MAEASDTFEILHQNLLDAGCDDSMVQLCIRYARQNEWKNISVVLKKHKDDLLEQIHNNQKRIDCLDFLVYQIQRKNI